MEEAVVWWEGSAFAPNLLAGLADFAMQNSAACYKISD